MMQENVARKGQEWSEDHERLLDGIATIVESNYDDLYELAQESAEAVMETPLMQEREDYWMTHLENLEEDGFEEVNIVAGLFHVLPAGNNFYSKLEDEGYDTNVQAIREFNGDHEEAYLWNLHE